MISFVPFLMILLAIAGRTGSDVSMLTNAIAEMVPPESRSYIISIIREVSSRSGSILPFSLLILIWSASKVFHTLTNGLNVISKVEETRGWLFLRIRSMLLVSALLGILAVGFVINIFGAATVSRIKSSMPSFGSLITFLYTTRSLYNYFVLILCFVLLYKVLPNCRYSFMSQFPGALLISTIWMFVSYLLSRYYANNLNLSNIYGSLTGLILAMLWMYFCFFFLLFGAELNRVIYEDPEDNIFVSTIGEIRDANDRKLQQIKEELDEHSGRKNLTDREEESQDLQPKDIVIPWADEIGP